MDVRAITERVLRAAADALAESVGSRATAEILQRLADHHRTVGEWDTIIAEECASDER